MADKIIGLRINVVGTDDIVKRIGSLNAELEKTKLEASLLQKSLRAAVSANNAEDVAKYSQELAQARARQNDLKSESAALNKELRLQQKAFKASAADGVDSYRALDAQLSVLRDRFKSLSAAEREGAVGKEITEQIDLLNGQLVEADAKLGVFGRNVGNYSDSVVKALRRAANEEALIKDINQLNAETDKLKGRFRTLYDTLQKGDKSADTANTVKELAQIEKQIKINQSALKDLGGKLADTKTLESQKGVSGRDIGKIGKAGGGGAAAGFAGQFLQGSEAASKFGAVGIAAFGIFAAGGLAFKAISALDELTKRFQKLENDTARFSGASGIALTELTANVDAVANTFGQDAGDILKTTQSLSKNLGVDFATALKKVEQGLLTGAGGAEGFLDALGGSAEAARIAGLSIDELIGFSNEATKEGILSERGIELVSEFGKNIVTNSAEAKDALTNALGAEFTNSLFDNVQNGSTSTAQAVQLVSAKLNEAGITGDQAGKVLADAFGTATAAENEFVLGLNKTIGGIGSYIDKTNSLTSVQLNQLKANKELSSAQAGLATAFEKNGISLDAFGTKIKTVLANVATKAVIAFNTIFGDGLAAGREQLRKTTEALNEQNENIRNLETGISPLLRRYDELTAILPTLAEGSDEAKAAQAELAAVIGTVGDAIPSAVSGFGDYNEALGLNTTAANEFIAAERARGKTLEEAQATVAIEQFRKLREESDKIKQSFDAQGGSVKRVSVGYLEALINPVAAVKGLGQATGITNEVTARSAEETLEAGKALNQYGKELKEVEAILKQTEAGRRELATTLALQSADFTAFNAADISKRQAEIFERLNKEALEAAGKGEKEKANAAKKATDAEIERTKADNAKKAQEAAKAAAEKAKAERDKLIEEEKTTRSALDGAKRDTDKAITELSIQGIQDRAKREEDAITFSTSQRIESETKGLQDAGEARIKTLKQIAESSDSELRKQFGTPEQIAEQINEVNAEVRQSIQAQTSLILKERDKQIQALQSARAEAIKQAVQTIEADALQGALGELQSRINLASAAENAIQLRVEVAQDDIDAAAKLATANLAVLRAGNLISEKEYQSELKAIEQNAAKERIDVLINSFDDQSDVIAERAELQKLQIEGNLIQQVDSLKAAAEERTAALKTQLDEQLITEQQYNEAVLAINDTTAEQIVLANKVAAVEIVAIDDNAAKERIGLEREVTDAQLTYLTDRADAYRESQQALLKQFAEGVSEAGNLILNSAKIIDDFFTASENNKKADIEARYSAELQGAQGNATAIASIERRKAAELEKIERDAAARRKAIAIAQAIINGAVAITNIIATTPDPTGIFTAIRVAAAAGTTAAQIALISSQAFEKGGVIPPSDGFISGRSHAEGGVHGFINGRSIEAEGGEFKATDESGNGIIVNRKSSRIFKGVLKSIAGKQFAGKRQVLSDINSYNGLGVRFAQGGSIPPQSVGNGIANGGGQNQMQAIMQLINETRNLALEVSQQVNRLTVVADPQAIVEQGMKDTPLKNTQIL
jgi:hypothetical protein